MRIDPVPAPPTQQTSVLSLEDLIGAAQGDLVLLERVSEALGRSDPGDLAAAAELSAARVASLILLLKPKRARALLRLLPDMPNLAVLSTLDAEVRARLIDADGQRRLTRLIGGLDAASAADVLAGLPAPIIEAALAGHPRAAEIRDTLIYEEDEAGAVMMRRQLVAIPPDWTLGQVVAEIRSRSEEIERLYAVYVVDAERRLVGYLKLRDLLTQPPEVRVGDAMRADVVAVNGAADREEVVRIADLERIPAVPVTDDRGRLVGIIRTEEIRAIGREELAEDLKLLSSAPPDSDPSDGPVTILRRRFPWLASALIGALGAGLIVGSFEDALEEAVILASLIPMVMDMAGNAGIQASTVTIEAMAGKSFWRGDILGRFLRELGGAVLNGTAVGVLTAGVILILSTFIEIEQPVWLALTAAITLVLIIIQAAVVGVLVPLGLKKLRFDPAVGTGVFITTVNDFAGIMVLFLVAKMVYLPHL